MNPINPHVVASILAETQAAHATGKEHALLDVLAVMRGYCGDLATQHAIAKKEWARLESAPTKAPKDCWYCQDTGGGMPPICQESADLDECPACFGPL